MFQVPEENRFTQAKISQFRFIIMPELASDHLCGNNGMFVLQRNVRGHSAIFRCLASDGHGWEHVSVTVVGVNRCPSWNEMCFIRDKFWGPEDTVLQFHPPHSEYVSTHPYCLHLWRPKNEKVPRPPMDLVGVPKSKYHG